jgi:TRAP-type C4-dicarboxylate transport system permease small subunit
VEHFKGENIMKRLADILNVIEFLSKVFFYIAAVSLVVIFLLIFLDVALRFTINLPVEGADIYASYLMVAVGFMALGYGELTGAHVKMEYFGNKLFGKSKKYLELLVLLIVIGFFVVMTLQIGKRAEADLVAKILTPNSTITLQVWWLSGIAGAGSGMLVVALIVEFIRKTLKIIVELPQKQLVMNSEK